MLALVRWRYVYVCVFVFRENSRKIFERESKKIVGEKKKEGENGGKGQKIGEKEKWGKGSARRPLAPLPSPPSLFYFIFFSKNFFEIFPFPKIFFQNFFLPSLPIFHFKFFKKKCSAYSNQQQHNNNPSNPLILIHSNLTPTTSPMFSPIPKCLFIHPGFPSPPRTPLHLAGGHEDMLDESEEQQWWEILDFKANRKVGFWLSRDGIRSC